MCKCVNIEIGSYGNQVELKAPDHMIIWLKINQPHSHMPRTDIICVDRCLSDEIKYLWSLGITTTGCCYGHNKDKGYIGVIDTDIPRMKELGYIVAPNPCRPDDEDSFYPQTK